MSRRISAIVAALVAAGCSSADPVLERQRPLIRTELPEEGRLTVVPAPPATPSDGIAARINNEIITWKDVLDSLKLVKPADITADLRKSRLRELAEEKLFLQAARQNQLSISEQELDEAVRREIKNAGGEEEFEKYLRIRNITRTEHREQTRRLLLRYKLFRHLLQKSWTNPGKDTPGLMLDFVAPEEIRAYYEAHPEQFRAIEHITFWRIGLQFATAQQEEAKRAVAESVLRKLEEGGEFSMIAYFYSDISRSGRGYREQAIKRKDAQQFYEPATVKYLFDEIKEGDVSPILKDGKTLNIFKMEQKVSQKEEPFEEAQVKIRSALENDRREKNRKMLRDHLLKEAYVWPPDLFDVTPPAKAPPKPE